MQRRLLIIDDDDEIRDIFQIFMSREGYVIDQAIDGAKGLEKILSFKPDAIILDLMMPHLDGVGVLDRMAHQGINIPVIVISGFSNRDTETIVRQTPNVVDFIAKPIHYAGLLTLLSRLFSEKKK